MARVGRVLLDLLAEAAYVDSHGSRVEGRLVAPHAAHQLVAREDPARVSRQKPEQVELLRRETEGTPRASHVSCARVDLDVTEAEALVGRLSGVSAAQHRPHPHRQLAG